MKLLTSTCGKEQNIYSISWYKIVGMIHLISALLGFPCDVLKGTLNHFGATCVIKIEMNRHKWH